MSVSLLLRNLIFTLVVPGSAAILIPWLHLAGRSAQRPLHWVGAIPIALGAALYTWCVWRFAVVGGGTPGPWDAPRRLVAVGPYRWVRNPIYLSVLLVVVGEALLFRSLWLAAYAVTLAAVFHLFIVGYEEPTLHRSFGEEYTQYRHRVPRWVPRPPRG